jgi:hypothetical protein
LACIWLIWKLVERIADSIPPWIPVLTAACSLWLFHYARSGLRAICSPFFLAAFTLLLDRAERRPNDRAAGLLCGAVLGLSIYGYTSNRALAIAFVGYAAFRLIRQWKTEVRLARLYSTIALGALVVSIPNLLFFLRQPRDFLFRGSYVLRGGMSDWAVNTMGPSCFRSTTRTFIGTSADPASSSTGSAPDLRHPASVRFHSFSRPPSWWDCGKRASTLINQ